MDNLRLIVLDNCKELGEEINREINKLRGTNDNYIVPIEEVRFNNGEGKLVIKDTIRDKDVYIISDVGNYSCTYKMFNFINHMGPDEHFQDIKRVFYAIRGNAENVSVIMPLLYESRQHRRKSRESLDCAIALQDLIALGARNIITFDAHDPGIHNAVPVGCFESFYCSNNIISDFIDNEKIDFRKLLFISPDIGATDRARFYSELFKTELGLFYKRRDPNVMENGKNKILEHKYIGEDVTGKNIMIVDDMIASGESVLDVARDLKAIGAEKIYVSATFALFTNGLDSLRKAHEEGLIEKIYTTNLTYMPKEYLDEDFIHVVNCSPLVAEIINNINMKKSLAPIINEKEKILKKINNTLHK